MSYYQEHKIVYISRTIFTAHSSLKARTRSRLRDRRGGCDFWRIGEIPILQKPLGPLAEIQIFDTEGFLSAGISPTDKTSLSASSAPVVIANNFVLSLIRVLLSKSLSVLELIRTEILNGHPEVVIEEELVCRP